MADYPQRRWCRAGWAEKPLSLGIDQGGTRALWLVEAMIAREAIHG